MSFGFASRLLSCSAGNTTPGDIPPDEEWSTTSSWFSYERLALLFPVIVFGPMFCFSGSFLKACATTPYEMTMEQVEECPEATAVLGDDIGSTVGLGCGNTEQSDGHGYVDWNFPISGEKSRGMVFLNAAKRGGEWRIDRLDLVVDEEEIDVLECN